MTPREFDGYYEAPYFGECPECCGTLNEYGECSICMEDEFYRETEAEAA